MKVNPLKVLSVSSLLFNLVCLCTSVTLLAGSSGLRGRVVSGNGDELAGATVYLLPSREHVPLDVNGEYDLSGIEAGTYSIAIVHPGYRFYTTTVNMSEAQTVTRNLVMIPDKFDEESALYEQQSELNKMLLSCSPKRLTADGADRIISPRSSGDTPHSGAQEAPHIEKSEPSGNIQTLSNKSEGDLVLSVAVVPNPTSEHASVQFQLKSEARVLLELFHMENGKRVVLEDFGMLSPGSNVLDLNVANLSAGTYTVLVRASTCQYALSTFVKN